MQREFRNGRADREDAQRRAAPCKFGIAFERARDRIHDQRSAKAMTDNDDLIEVSVANPVEYPL
jgi:hypothetical protein